jgi:hypothetical protein
MDVKTHLIKEFTWKLNNGLSMVDSYAFKHYPSEAYLKWGLEASVKDYLEAFHQLMAEGVIKARSIYNGYRWMHFDESWDGKFFVWEILEVVKN